MPISEQVKELEHTAQSLARLCDFILATLEINIKRGTLTCSDQDYLIEVVSNFRSNYKYIVEKHIERGNNAAITVSAGSDKGARN